MKNLLITIAVLLGISCSVYANSESDKEIISQEVKLKTFDKIKVNTCVVLKYAQNEKNEQRIMISGRRKDLKELTLSVRNNTLYIDADFKVNSLFSNQEEVKINITTAFLNRLELNSAADVYLVTSLKDEKNIDFTINGAGDIKTKDLMSKNINININGAGDIETEKITCQNFNFTNNGSGDLEVDAIQCKESGMIKTNGSGDTAIEKMLCNKFIYTNNSSADVEIEHLTCHKYSIKTRGSGETEIKGIARNGEIFLSGSGDISLGHLETDSIMISSNGSGDIHYNAQETLSLKKTGSGDIKNFK